MRRQGRSAVYGGMDHDSVPARAGQEHPDDRQRVVGRTTDGPAGARGRDQARYERPPRPNPKLEPYVAQVRELYFAKHLIGSRILREVEKLGYQGGSTALYTYLRGLRRAQPSSKATMRFETEPGQQAQFDWSPYTVEIAGELRRLVVYGMTLGYSRRKHYTASFDERQPSIFEAIEESLWHFGGSAKEQAGGQPSGVGH